MTSLRGRGALVTGGGRGIGAATAVALAEAGARVSLAARSEDQVREVAAGLRSRGLEAFAFGCDVTDPQQVRELARGARQEMGSLDILVHSAGTSATHRLGRIGLEDWRRIMDVNATSTFLCTQAVFDEMVANGWGRIVNVASMSGLEGGKFIAAYTASKHAAIGFTKAAAAEAEGTGVCVSAVCPGFVDTPLTDAILEQVMRASGGSREQTLAGLLDQAGQSRLLETGEVADAILGLCGEAAADRNGEILVLDGRGPG